jgi:predicted metal-dependent phosphoesterase TrpH
MRIRADLHTHAIGDGQYDYVPVEDLVRRHVYAAIEAGFDCIAITDHDDLRPGSIAAEYAARESLPILILAGMEVSTDDGHLVVIGIDSPIPPARDLDTTLKEARQQDALCILPHPFFPALRERTDVDAIEEFNARYGTFEIATPGMTTLANSDAHSAADIEQCTGYNEIEVAEHSFSGLVDAIRQQRVTTRSRVNQHEIWHGNND